MSLIGATTSRIAGAVVSRSISRCGPLQCARLCTNVRLLSASELAALEPSTARQLTVRVPDESQSLVRLLDVFVVKDADGSVTAFENYCPHAGGALNMIPDRFFSRDGQYLLCTRHGAKFLPTDGLCVHGPCAGDALEELPIECDEAKGVFTQWASLHTLCKTGGGAFVVRPAESLEASGPVVSRPKDSNPTTSTTARVRPRKVRGATRAPPMQ